MPISKKEAVEEFKQMHAVLIEKKLSENLVDDIISAWNEYERLLNDEGKISDKRYISWQVPNFETDSYVQKKIDSGSKAIEEAKQQGKEKAIVMHVRPCKIHKAVNPPRTTILTYELLSPGAKKVYDHFQQDGYTLTLHANQDAGDLRELFNMVVHW